MGGSPAGPVRGLAQTGPHQQGHGELRSVSEGKGEGMGLLVYGEDVTSTLTTPPVHLSETDLRGRGSDVLEMVGEISNTLCSNISFRECEG